MRSRLALFFLMVFVLSGVVSAQEVDGVQFFPIVARTAGVGGSQWVTDLTIHNLQDESIAVGLQFFPANQANTFDMSFPDRVLDADATIVAEGSRTVPRLSVKQWSLSQLGVGMEEGSLTVELWLDPGSVSPDPCDDPVNAIIGYVSKVDNGTGDAEFLYAAPSEYLDCDW